MASKERSGILYHWYNFSPQLDLRGALLGAVTHHAHIILWNDRMKWSSDFRVVFLMDGLCSKNLCGVRQLVASYM